MTDPSAFLRCVGLELEGVGPTHVTGSVLLGLAHHAPGGVVHGGVYATIIESAAGVGAGLAARQHGKTAVGVANSTDFVRPMVAGRVSVVADALHQGRSQQLWVVRLQDEEGRLVASGSVRLQNVDRRPGQ